MELSRRDLDEDTWTAAWTEGRKMSIDEAVEYALTAEPVAPEVHGILRDRTEALTPRESEIAHLIARGLTNRSIASELSISERTVTTHVSRILKKLNLHSRTGIAARILDQIGSSKQT